MNDYRRFAPCLAAAVLLRGWIGIVALAVITVAAAVASTVAVGRLRPARDPAVAAPASA